MKLLVCLKQVPELSAGVPDETLGLIFPENAPQAVSVLDACALEAAARIQDEDPACSITLLALDGETALRDGLSAVGEEALLLRDPFFAGADPVAKGVSLAAAVREWERRRGGPFDLILCGQQSSDLGSGLTGPVLAGCLGRPAVSGVLEAAVEGDRFRFRRQIQDGVQAVTAPRPCVALVTWTGYSLRFPNILRRMEAVDRMLPEIDIGDVLVIHDTGAHGFSMGYNYNGKLRSAEVLLKEDGSHQLIRRAETPADYFATFDFTPFFKDYFKK